MAGLASQGLALVSVSAGAASSMVVVPTPTDPEEFRKSTRDLKALSATSTPMKSEGLTRTVAHIPEVIRVSASRRDSGEVVYKFCGPACILGPVY